MWEALMSKCAWYFDRPTIDQEIKMKREIQRDFDPLFPEGVRPRLQSRRDLLSWACYSYTAAVNTEDVKRVDLQCENHAALLNQYGPNYDGIKRKLSHVRGLFTDED